MHFFAGLVAGFGSRMSTCSQEMDDRFGHEDHCWTIERRLRCNYCNHMQQLQQQVSCKGNPQCMRMLADHCRWVEWKGVHLHCDDDLRLTSCGSDRDVSCKPKMTDQSQRHDEIEVQLCLHLEATNQYSPQTLEYYLVSVDDELHGEPD